MRGSIGCKVIAMMAVSAEMVHREIDESNESAGRVSYAMEDMSASMSGINDIATAVDGNTKDVVNVAENVVELVKSIGQIRGQQKAIRKCQ